MSWLVWLDRSPEGKKKFLEDYAKKYEEDGLGANRIDQGGVEPNEHKVWAQITETQHRGYTETYTRERWMSMHRYCKTRSCRARGAERGEHELHCFACGKKLLPPRPWKGQKEAEKNAPAAVVTLKEPATNAYAHVRVADLIMYESLLAE